MISVVRRCPPAMIHSRRPLALPVILGVAIGLRTLQWGKRQSLWIDESMLAINIVSRSFTKLMPPLDHDQSAPLLFLWLERLAVRVAGPSELALRIVPLIAGILAIVLLFRVGTSIFGPTVGLLASGYAAVLPGLVRYSDEVKQYSVEATVSLILVVLVERWDRLPFNRRSSLTVAVAGAVAVWLSATAVFVLVGCSVVIARGGYVGDSRTRRLSLAILILWACSFATAYAVVYRNALISAYMLRYWHPGFLAPFDPGFLSRCASAVKGVMWGALSGSEPPRHLSVIAGIGSIGIAIAALATFLSGMLKLAQKNPRKACLIVCPLFVVVVASSMGLYPIAFRTIIFILPLMILVCAAGFDFLTSSSLVPRMLRWSVGCLLLAWPLTVSAIRGASADLPENLRPLIKDWNSRRNETDVTYVLAGAIPAWTFYTINWSSPDLDRLAFLNMISKPGGPAFNNAPFSRSRFWLDDGELTQTGAYGLELFGVSTGLEMSILGPTSRRYEAGWQDSTWAAHEASRIFYSGRQGAWIVLSHYYGPEMILLHTLESLGARRTYFNWKVGCMVVHYDLHR